MYDLQPAARQMASLVAGVADEQLSAPTPCTDMTLGDLLNHIDLLSQAFADAAGKQASPLTSQPPPPPDRSRLRDDWRTRIPHHVTALAAAWQDPAAWEGSTQIAGAEMPAEAVGMAGLDELVVHGWDVARSSGQAYDGHPETLEACLGFVAAMSPPDQRTGGDGLFEPAVDVPDDAPPLDRLIGLTGRDPSWRPA